MATITVNGQKIEFEGRLNVIQAAAKGGILIPHYCYHPALSVVGSCRMCLVEIGEMKDGQVSMMPKLTPACNTLARDGMVVVSNSAKVRAAQKAVLEFLLLNHPLDCPVCDQAGECLLQDFSYQFGRAYSRFEEDKIQRRKKDVGDHVVLFTDRCILCTRCVRFCREIAGTGELGVVGRGAHEEIDTFPGRRLNNKLSGNVVDICPVGALCSKEFLYQQRVWFLEETPSVCPVCSAGCSIRVCHNKGRIYRLVPRVNPLVNGYWMCDEGRLGYGYVHRTDRLREVLLRDDEGLRPATWAEALAEIAERVRETAGASAGSVAVVVSPHLTVEEAYLACLWAKGISAGVRLGLGPVPVQGQDETFKAGFTIRAEKVPNRRGVEMVLRHFQGEVIGFDRIVNEVEAGRVKALYLTGGYAQPWVSDEALAALERLDMLVVQDILPSRLTETADYVLPGATFAEKEGSFVNQAGVLQTFSWAFPPRGQAWPDGRVFWTLLGREGLYVASAVLEEMAARIPAFRKAMPDQVGDLGVTVD